MNRRGFLGLFGAATVGAVASEQLLELLTPKRSIFLPPAGGWVTGNRLMTINEITWECLTVVKLHWDSAGVLNGMPIKASDTFTLPLLPSVNTLAAP